MGKPLVLLAEVVPIEGYKVFGKVLESVASKGISTIEQLEERISEFPELGQVIVKYRLRYDLPLMEASGRTNNSNYPIQEVFDFKGVVSVGNRLEFKVKPGKKGLIKDFKRVKPEEIKVVRGEAGGVVISVADITHTIEQLNGFSLVPVKTLEYILRERMAYGLNVHEISKYDLVRGAGLKEGDVLDFIELAGAYTTFKPLWRTHRSPINGKKRGPKGKDYVKIEPRRYERKQKEPFRGNLDNMAASEIVRYIPEFESDTKRKVHSTINALGLKTVGEVSRAGRREIIESSSRYIADTITGILKTNFGA